MAYVENQDAYDRAIKRNIKQNAAKTRKKKWFAAHEDAQRLYDWLNQLGEFAPIYVTDDGVEIGEHPDFDNYRGGVHAKENMFCDGMFAGSFGNFLLKMRDNLHEYGGLTDKQTMALRKAFLNRCNYVANAKKRRAEERAKQMKSKFVGEIKERREFDLKIKFVTSFETRFGITYINVMEDSDGNIIVGKGTKRYGEKGEPIKVIVTITKHDIRDGIEQTIVNRPKFIKE